MASGTNQQLNISSYERKYVQISLYSLMIQLYEKIPSFDLTTVNGWLRR